MQINTSTHTRVLYYVMQPSKLKGKKDPTIVNDVVIFTVRRIEEHSLHLSHGALLANRHQGPLRSSPWRWRELSLHPRFGLGREEGREGGRKGGREGGVRS